MTYSYECKECNTKETRQSSVDNRDEQSCKECGNKLNRVFVASSGIVTSDGFKG